MALVLATLAIAPAGRGVLLRRHARRNEFYHDWYARKAANHHEAARECLEFGGERMIAVAKDYQAMGDAEARQAAEHAALALAYWRAFWRPWLVPPTDPGPAPP